METLNIAEVMRFLPHRFPFLLVDRVIEVDDLLCIRGIKNVTINEPFFKVISRGILSCQGYSSLRHWPKSVAF